MQHSESGHAAGVVFPPAEQRSRDREIVAIRRLDWRFLLPEPEFRRVGYLGATDSDLQTALRDFCGNLVVLAADDTDSIVGGADLDLLVARRCALREIQNVLGRLKSGGFLYWEVERSGPLDWKTGDAFQFCRALKTLHFSDVHLYWHRPNFSRCKEMIPLDRSNAVSFAMNKGHTGLRGRLKEIGGKLLKNSGILPYLVPCFSIVGQKG